MGYRGPVKSLKFYSWHSVCVSVCACVFMCVYVCPVERAMAPHSSTLTWKIPWTEEPGGLQSMGSLRVGHD